MQNKNLFLSVLEISTHDYGPHNERLTRKIKNGLNVDYRLRTEFTQQNQSLAIAGRETRIILFIISISIKYVNCQREL